MYFDRAPRRRAGIACNHLGAGVLDAETLLDEFGHLAHERVQVGRRDVSGEHDGDLAEHALLRPLGEFGE